MKLPENFRTRSRLFAAGLCGATVLAFSAVDGSRVEAQQTGESEPLIKSAQTEADAEAQASPAVDASEAYPEAASDEETAKVENRIDLSKVTFDGEVIQKVGEEALIVRSSERELLLPMSVVSMSGSESADTTLLGPLTQDDLNSVSDAAGQEVASTDLTESEESADTTVDADTAANADSSADESSDLENDNYTPMDGESTASEPSSESSTQQATSENKTVAVGDQIHVKLSATDAEIVALENGVLTVRADGSVMQLPADVLNQEQLSGVRVSAEGNGEQKSMTLQEAIQGDHQLSFTQDLSSTMPAGAKVGVLVANEGDRLILATPSEGKIQLVAVPQAMQAGKAVSLEQGEGKEVAVELLQRGNQQIEHKEITLKGTLVSSTDNALVLKSGEQTLLMPAEAKLQVNGKDTAAGEVKDGEAVSVVLPAGSAELLAVMDGLAVLDTGDGIAQLPLEQLQQSLTKGELSNDQEGGLAQTEIPGLDSMEGQEPFQGVVVGREDSLIVASLTNDQKLMRVPASKEQSDIQEGAMVKIDPSSQTVSSMETDNAKTEVKMKATKAETEANAE